MERSSHFRKGDLDVGRPVNVNKITLRCFNSKSSNWDLRGMPGEEAQLSTSTVTEDTETELGRLSTLTFWG